MNIVTAIIGLLMLGLFALPFILTGNSRRKMEKKMLVLLQQHAVEQGHSIGEHDLGARFGIALSQNQQMVYFIDGHNGTPIIQHFALPDIRQCKMNVVKNPVGNSINKEWVVVKIELILTSKTPQIADQRYGLYDVNNLVQLDNELELATKWETKLNSLKS